MKISLDKPYVDCDCESIDQARLKFENEKGGEMAVIYLLTKVQEAQTQEQRLKLRAALDEHFQDKWHEVGQDCYLVATNRPLLTEELSRELKITDGEVGSYIVTNLDPYYGFANRSIWEWVRNMRQWNEQS